MEKITRTQQQTKQPPKVGYNPVTSTSSLSYNMTYTERTKLKEVRSECCNRLICKASEGSVIEHKCKCGKTDVYKVAA